jgi:hypothetical protein
MRAAASLASHQRQHPDQNQINRDDVIQDFRLYQNQQAGKNSQNGLDLTALTIMVPPCHRKPFAVRGLERD